VQPHETGDARQKEMKEEIRKPSFNSALAFGIADA
jgi:hypothetical protein